MAPAAAPPLPELLDQRAADTKAGRNRTLRLYAGFQRLDDTVTKVLRIRFHTLSLYRRIPYRQLQPALGILKGILMLGCTGLDAGMMYGLDPRLGRRRRALVRDKVRAY
jgi:hypothetical protein